MAGLTLLATAGAAGMTGIPQYFEGKKAAREAARLQERANDVSQASAQVENARRRRRAIAQARIAQASNQANMGEAIQSSSALSGVQSAIGSQLGANLGAQSQAIGNQQRIMDLNQAGSNALRRGQERAGMWTAAGQTMQTVTGALSGGASFGGSQAAGAGANFQGQATPLYNNPAFIRNF